MKNRILVPLIFVTVVSLSILLLFGCGSNPSGGGGTSGHGTYSYLGTQSPGDVWAWTIGRDTFICTDETASLTISGTWLPLPSGFKRALVDYSSDPASVEAGSVAYFLEYPNILLIVKPTGEAGNDNVIICAGRPRFAPSTFGTIVHLSGVAIPGVTWASREAPSYGKVDTIQAGSTFTFTVEGFDLGDVSATAESGSGFIFNNGRFTEEGTSIQIFITSSGAFVCDMGTLEGGYAGMQTLLTSFNSKEVANHSYRGVLFTYDTTNATGETKPIKAQASPLKDGSINGYEFSDVETGSLETGPSLTLELTSFDTPHGIIKGTVSINGNKSDIRVAANKIGSKYILFGITADPSGNPQDLLLIQK